MRYIRLYFKNVQSVYLRYTNNVRIYTFVLKKYILSILEVNVCIKIIYKMYIFNILLYMKEI